MTASSFVHNKRWCTIQDQEPGCQLSVTSTRVHVRGQSHRCRMFFVTKKGVGHCRAKPCVSNQKRCRELSFLVRSFLQTWPKKKWVACARQVQTRVVASLSQFHRLHHEMGQMTNVPSPPGVELAAEFVPARGKLTTF